MNGFTIGGIVAILGAVGSGYAWDLNQREKVHEEIEQAIDAEHHASNVELDLASINLELKMYRNINERRELTEDERDRVEFLKQKRMILIAEQKKQVA